MSSNLKPKADRRKKTATESGSLAVATAGASEISRAEIARKAYELYCARGGQNGSELDDWLRAERELQGAPVRAQARALGNEQPRRRATRKSASLD